MKFIISWVKANPNKCGVISWSLYSWLKAAALARFGYKFLPETDALIMATFTALGLYSVTRKAPPKQ